MESAMADPDWLDDEIAARLAEHYTRERLRESKKTERRNRWQKILLDGVRVATEPFY